MTGIDRTVGGSQTPDVTVKREAWIGGAGNRISY